MHPLLAASGTEHYILLDVDGTKGVVVRNDGFVSRLPLDSLIVHGTAPVHWYTNECANTCNHPSRDYHCNHVSWAQMWTY